VLDERREQESRIAGADDEPLASVAPPTYLSLCGEADDRPGVDRHGSAWRKWAVIAVSLSVATVVALLVLSGRGRNNGMNQAAQHDLMVGSWQASGRVVRTHDSAFQTPGEVIYRMWLIRKACAQQTCQLELVRQVAGSTADTVGGVLTAPLMWADGKWTATFTEPNVYCATGGPVAVAGTEDSSWTIALTAGGAITAVEHTRTSAPHCVTGTTELTWTARKYSGLQTPTA
jgi:hypothetical protein